MRRIENRDDWDGLDRWEKEQYLDALEAVGHMRRGSSLADAAARVGRSENEVLGFSIGDVVHSDGRGNWVAEPQDELWRPMRILTADGIRDIGVKNSVGATVVSDYWRGVGKLINEGDASGLAGFSGKFLTDPDAIYDWWRRGELDFIQIYRDR